MTSKVSFQQLTNQLQKYSNRSNVKLKRTKKIKHLNNSLCWEVEEGFSIWSTGRPYFGTKALTHIILEMFIGTVENPYVCHHCDNKACIRPEHLYYGDHQQNMKDAKERLLFNKGTANGMSKLTTQQVEDLRSGKISVKELHKITGVNEHHLRRVRRGLYYQNVPATEKQTFYAQGSSNGNAKTKDGDHKKIYELYQTGKFTYKELGDLFNISSHQINKILQKQKRIKFGV